MAKQKHTLCGAECENVVHVLGKDSKDYSKDYYTFG